MVKGMPTSTWAWHRGDRGMLVRPAQHHIVQGGHDDVGDQGANENYGERERHDEDKVNELALKFEVHEESGHERGLDGGDGEGEEDLDPFLVDVEKGRADGEERQHHEDAEDHEIIDLVMRHRIAVAVCF